MITGHIDNTDPFDINLHVIVSDYIQNHNETSQKLYEKKNKSTNTRVNEISIN